MQSSSARSRNSTLVGFSNASIILVSYFVGRGKYSMAGPSAGTATDFAWAGRGDDASSDPVTALSADCNWAAPKLGTAANKTPHAIPIMPAGRFELRLNSKDIACFPFADRIIVILNPANWSAGARK